MLRVFLPPWPGPGLLWASSREVVAPRRIAMFWKGSEHPLTPYGPIGLALAGLWSAV